MNTYETYLFQCNFLSTYTCFEEYIITNKKIVPNGVRMQDLSIKSPSALQLS